jgi:isopentenyldiphosphate isomerase
VEELFDLVDENDVVIGAAGRSECHGDPALIHRAVHVLVFRSDGSLFLQRRSEEKEIQPGKWDTSVGGHLASGESYIEAACRETREELGFEPVTLTYLFSFKVRNNVESENIKTYFSLHDGLITTHPGEIAEGRFWTLSEISKYLGSGEMTPAFEHEFELLRSSSLVDNQGRFRHTPDP